MDYYSSMQFQTPMQYTYICNGILIDFTPFCCAIFCSDVFVRRTFPDNKKPSEDGFRYGLGNMPMPIASAPVWQTMLKGSGLWKKSRSGNCSRT